MDKSNSIPKMYISYARGNLKKSGVKKIAYIIKSLLLSPLAWSIAYIISTPGLLFRRLCAQIGVRLIFTSHDFKNAFFLLFSPMDSVRYFEFDFAWHAIKKTPIQSYLDISSPRLFPLMVLYKNKNLVADLNNPDQQDLQLTKSLAKSIGIDSRCNFHDSLIDDIHLSNSQFDVITSLSVIEHIVDDKKAIQKMWDLLRPGGRLIISVPCSAVASEEYINIDTYKLLIPDENGYIFWQRYYSEELLKSNIYSITGEPYSCIIYGEKEEGSYFKNVKRKREDPYYPLWFEPVMMGLEYAYKNSISELPGVGVVAMEFIKKV